MKLTTLEGMQSEIFVPVTPEPVFTELKKPLSECKVAFITAGGIHKKSHYRFLQFRLHSKPLFRCFQIWQNK